jgi:1,4-dihydroxy-2-naphthoate octaprenyltransferase
MAYSDRAWHTPSFCAALLGAMLIQIATNFANDYFDFAKGTDTADRVGPTRATQAGLVSPGAMKRATALTFLLTLVPGAYIVFRGGWPFVVIGALSILFGVLYTGGPYPLGYLGLGDILVLIFFGPVAVGGTYYLQSLTISSDVLVAGLAPGLFSVAILTVNNLRDIDGDRIAGKKTLAVRFGRTFAKFEYLLSVLGAACVIPIYLCLHSRGHYYALASALVLLPAIPSIKTVFTADGPALNGVLGATGKLLLIFTILFSIGWLL